MQKLNNNEPTIIKAKGISGKVISKALSINPNFMTISCLETGRLVAINKSFAELTGFSRRDIIGHTLADINLWAANEHVQIVQKLKDRKYVRDLEISFKKKDGEQRIGCFWGERFTFDANNYLVSVLTDVTEEKAVFHKLRLSEERFFKIFYVNPYMMAIYSLDTGKCIDVNESFLKYMEYTRAEVIGQSMDTLDFGISAHDRAMATSKFLENTTIKDLEFHVRTKSGQLRVILLSGNVIKLNEKPCILAVAVDITENKKLQKEMARLGQMHLVGQMAASIGHEIRNPMTTVRGYLQLLSSKEALSAYHEHFTTMIDELDRANSIISEFLSLAKDKVAMLHPSNLNEVIQPLIPLLEADAVTNSKIINFALEEVPDILLDEKEIRQLLLNLARNGLEAMKEGETLTIQTYFDGKNIVLSIQDQGRGIPDHILEKLGTPFLTTKENGLGLGLPICYSIANRHNATIDVESSSSGTTFCIRFKFA